VKPHAGKDFRTVTPALQQRRRPYGLAFAIEDLKEIARWALAHQLVMLIVLDRLVGDIEFEEMVVLSTAGRRERRVMMWRSFGTIYAQPVSAKPRGFTTVLEALNWLSPPPSSNPMTFVGKLRNVWRALAPADRWESV
jgi:hypothetical protein